MSKPPLLNRLRAAKAYTGFTGHLPDSSYSVNLDDKPVAGYRLGQTVGIAYEATRDGVTDQYFHKFKQHARPDLVVKDDGSQLYVTRGAYKVGDRGIEDMPALMVLNPSPRPSLRRRTSKGRFMRLAARPLRRRRRARAHKGVSLFTRNPVGFARPRRRRRAASRRRSPVVFKVNPAARHRRRRSYKRNPIGGGRFGITALVMPAVGIALGAIGSELAMGYLPIPANLKTGTMRHITKGAISLAAGYAIAKFGRQPKIGEAFALGGLVIAFHDAGKDLMLKFWPSAQFGAYMRPGMGYYSPGAQVSLPRMNMQGALPARPGSPGGPNAFGLYTQFGGHASDGGPEMFRP